MNRTTSKICCKLWFFTLAVLVLAIHGFIESTDQFPIQKCAFSIIGMSPFYFFSTGKVMVAPNQPTIETIGKRARERSR